MEILGQELLTNVFGHWPCFHDSEVVRFALERPERGSAPVAKVDVHVFEMTGEVGADGAYVLNNHSLVSFRFVAIDELCLEGFNNQNALFDLEIRDIRDRQLERFQYEVTFASSYGMSAHFLCEDVVVEGVRPWPALR